MMITRTAIRFQQKDKRIYFSTFTAEELSRFCGVAQLQEEDLDNQNRYQRDVTQSKINEITDWWDKEENYLPNPVIIYFPNFNNVDISFAEGQDTGSIRVDVLENLAQILDGQHRVNGCHGSVNFRMELLPVTIIFGGEGGDFTPQEVGRMFITMNSKSDRIGKLLEMHLLARNDIPPWDGANQAGYRLMRELYRNDTRNPLFGRIQIMDRRQGFDFK
jgi:DGQHR domain-containing protein